ncbi:MAG: RidA family protein [Pseudomonadota bacterium]|nr:RidA family protein [Pseudomonadota bacterium]
MTKRIELNPGWPWIEKIRVTPGIQVGETVYTSGQVALSADGEIIGPGDVAAQTRAVFDNLRAVLAEAGATMDDVVKILVFLIDMKDFQVFSKIRAETFPNKVPASSVVGAPAFAHSDLLIEIEAIAVVGSGS